MGLEKLTAKADYHPGPQGTRSTQGSHLRQRHYPEMSFVMTAQRQHVAVCPPSASLHVMDHYGQMVVYLRMNGIGSTRQPRAGGHCSLAMVNL